MNVKEIPKHHESLKSRFPKVMSALEELGKTAKVAGPIDEKTVHLMQMVAASAIHSEGAVHSHARRAIEVGANPDELYHCILVLVSTIGFPRVAAAVSWIDDVVKN